MAMGVTIFFWMIVLIRETFAIQLGVLPPPEVWHISLHRHFTVLIFMILEVLLVDYRFEHVKSDKMLIRIATIAYALWAAFQRYRPGGVKNYLKFFSS